MGRKPNIKKRKVPTHDSLMAPLYAKDPHLRRRIEAGVKKLKVITQIIELREKLGLTQTELARRLGTSQAFVAKIENDQASNLSLETLFKIVDAMNGDVEILIRLSKKAA